MNEWWILTVLVFAVIGVIARQFLNTKTSIATAVLAGFTMYLFVQLFVLPSLDYSDNRRPLFDSLLVMGGFLIGIGLGAHVNLKGKSKKLRK